MIQQVETWLLYRPFGNFKAVIISNEKTQSKNLQKSNMNGLPN